MPDPLHPRPEPSDADLARYVAETCAELRRAAEGRPALPTLRYLLDMTRIEAERLEVDKPPGTR